MRKRISYIYELWAMLFDDRANVTRQDLNQTDDNNFDQWTDI